MIFYTASRASKGTGMEQLSIKSGGSTVTDGFDGVPALHSDRAGGRDAGAASAPEDDSVKNADALKLYQNIQSDLKYITEDIVSLLSGLDAASTQEMLGQFVSDLFFALAQKRQREERLARQTEGIAAARERGVQFGRSRKPLPEDFEQYRAAWRGGRMSLREAAKACGMSHATFRNAAMCIESAG